MTTDPFARLAATAPKASQPGRPASEAARAIRTANDDDLRALGIEPGTERPYDDGHKWELSACPYSRDHDDGAFRVQHADGRIVVACLHNRCRGKTIARHRDLFPRTMKAIAEHPPRPTLRADAGPTVSGAPTGAAEQPAVFRLQTRKASDIEPREIKWIWKWWLPAGMIGLFAGYGGSGKSMIALWIIAACSVGGLLPDGQRAPVLNTLIFAAEDSPEHTIIPRLVAMGADLNRIHIVDGITRNDDDPGWVQLRNHAVIIEQAVNEHRIGLVLIDPVSSFIGDANSDKESDVRAGITPLIQMAERTGAAVLMIRHVSKAGDGIRAASRILGSTAWHDVPRVAWMLADAPVDHQPEPHEDGTRDTRRVLGVVKCNLAAKPPARWCHQPINGPLRWLPDPSPVTVDECFFAKPDRGSKGHAADEWATDYLKGGAKSSTQLFADAKGKFSEKTLRASLRRIGAESFQLLGKAHGGWFWRLPPVDGSLAHDGQVTQDTATSRHLVDSPVGSPDASDVGQIASLGHLPVVSARESDPSDQVTDALQHLDAINRADVEEIVTEMVEGGPVVVAEYRSRIAALPDSDRRLVELALRLAEMAAA